MYNTDTDCAISKGFQKNLQHSWMPLAGVEKQFLLCFVVEADSYLFWWSIISFFNSWFSNKYVQSWNWPVLSNVNYVPILLTPNIYKHVWHWLWSAIQWLLYKSTMTTWRPGWSILASKHIYKFLIIMNEWVPGCVLHCETACDRGYHVNLPWSGFVRVTSGQTGISETRYGHLIGPRWSAEISLGDQHGDQPGENMNI